MDLLSPRHLLILLVIVLLVFGTKKLKSLGPDLGHAFRGFKNAMKDSEDAVAAAQDTSTPENAKQIGATDKPAEKPAEKVAEKAAAADKVTHA